MSREVRSVLLLLGLAVLGHATRLLVQPRGAPPGQLLAHLQTPGLDPARQRAQAGRAARPLARDERIDLNTAPAVELARLPRVGMSLAKRIVADRLAHGRFRGLGDLDRVPGVGPGLLAVLRDRVSFGGQGGADPVLPQGDALARRTVGLLVQPGANQTRLTDLNSASEADLVALPGVGKARARAILAYRRENGPFALVSDLERVPGFSHALTARLAPLLVAR